MFIKTTPIFGTLFFTLATVQGCAVKPAAPSGSESPSENVGEKSADAGYEPKPGELRTQSFTLGPENTLDAQLDFVFSGCKQPRYVSDKISPEPSLESFRRRIYRSRKPGQTGCRESFSTQ